LVFFDAKYLEVSFGYFIGSGNWGVGTVSFDPNQIYVTLQSLNVGLLFKYPFTINNKFKYFPALGVYYQTVISIKANGVEPDIPNNFSNIWFQMGGGLDYNFSEKIYLRFEALYAFRPRNAEEKIEYNSIKNGSMGGPGNVEQVLGHGPTIKLALGYNL